jgi:hypothetical protein
MERRLESGDADVFSRLSKPKDSKNKGDEASIHPSVKDRCGEAAQFDEFDEEEAYLDAFENLTASLKLDSHESFKFPDFHSIDQFLSPPPVPSLSVIKPASDSYNDKWSTVPRTAYMQPSKSNASGSLIPSARGSYSMTDSMDVVYELDEFGRMVKL